MFNTKPFDKSLYPSGSILEYFLEHVAKVKKKNYFDLSHFQVFFQQPEQESNEVVDLNKQLIENPQLKLPENFIKVKEDKVEYLYSLAPYSFAYQISESQKICYDIVEDIIFVLFQVHLIEPKTYYTKLVKAKQKRQNYFMIPKTKKQENHSEGPPQNKNQSLLEISSKSFFKPKTLPKNAINKNLLYVNKQQKIINKIQQKKIEDELKKQEEELKKQKKWMQQKQFYAKKMEELMQKKKLENQKKQEQEEQLLKQRLEQDKKNKSIRDKQNKEQVNKLQQYKRQKETEKLNKQQAQDAQKSKLEQEKQKQVNKFLKDKREKMQKQFDNIKEKRENQQKEEEDKKLKEKQEKEKKNEQLNKKLGKEKERRELEDQTYNTIKEMKNSDSFQQVFIEYQKQCIFLFNYFVEMKEYNAQPAKKEMNYQQFFRFCQFFDINYIIQENQIKFIYNTIMKDQIVQNISQQGLNFSDFQECLLCLIIKGFKFFDTYFLNNLSTAKCASIKYNLEKKLKIDSKKLDNYQYINNTKPQTLEGLFLFLGLPSSQYDIQEKMKLLHDENQKNVTSKDKKRKIDQILKQVNTDDTGLIFQEQGVNKTSNQGGLDVLSNIQNSDDLILTKKHLQQNQSNTYLDDGNEQQETTSKLHNQPNQKKKKASEENDEDQ